jgi:hypothetical protein
VLRAFSLLGNINSYKKANVYRRSDASGVPVTTGNTLTATIVDTASLMQVISAYGPVEWVEVTNGNVTSSYDGTTWNRKTSTQTKKLSINNVYIPDLIVDDITFYLYQFFKTKRDRYVIGVGTPSFQFEPFDNCNMTYTTTKIQKTITGDGYPLYAVSYQADGSMEIEVLI